MSSDSLPYYRFPAFEHIYLEDSDVLKIEIRPSAVEFLLLVVLTENHRLFRAPKPGEQYCYRKALLSFMNVQSVRWLEKSLVEYTDANGAMDYGNIDEFYLKGDSYHLSGDWGKLEIQGDAPTIEFVD